MMLFAKYFCIYMVSYIIVHFTNSIIISYCYVLTALCLFITGEGPLILQRIYAITRNQWLLVFDIAAKQFIEN